LAGIVNDQPSVETTTSGPCLIATVHGIMDYGTQQELRERVHQVIAHAEHAVILDLRDVSFCDSAGLNVLLDARREAERATVTLAWPAYRPRSNGSFR
jgi:anti-anti-sigma factor